METTVRAASMRILTTTVLISALALGACGTIRDSVVNPVNWFGKGRSSNSAAEQSSDTNPLIQESRRGLFQSKDSEVVYLGKPIDQVTNLVIERVPGGAVIRATGLTAVQGVYLVQLTPTTEDETPINGVLALSLGRCAPRVQRRRRLNTHAHSRCGTCFDGSRAGRGA